MTQSRKPVARRRQKKVGFRTLAILATLTGLVNLIFIWLAWSLIQAPRTEDPSSAAIPFFLSLPEPGATPEPTFMPTQVVIATSTPAQNSGAGLSLAEITGGLIPPTRAPTPRPSQPPAGVPLAPEAPTATPQPGIDHVVIISID